MADAAIGALRYKFSGNMETAVGAGCTRVVRGIPERPQKVVKLFNSLN